MVALERYAGLRVARTTLRPSVSTLDAHVTSKRMEGFGAIFGIVAERLDAEGCITGVENELGLSNWPRRSGTR
jgi:hypothetical protein